jgi:hypothetical protein
MSERDFGDLGYEVSGFVRGCLLKTVKRRFNRALGVRVELTDMAQFLIQ